MPKRAYICESCFGKNYMSASEYEAKASSGLVYCSYCLPNVPPKRAPVVMVK